MTNKLFGLFQVEPTSLLSDRCVIGRAATAPNPSLCEWNSYCAAALSVNGEQHETGGSAADIRDLVAEMSFKHGYCQAVSFEDAV